MRWKEHQGLQTALCLLGPLVFYEVCMELASFFCAFFQIQDELAITGGGALFALPFLFAAYRKKKDRNFKKSREVLARGCLFSFLAGVGVCLFLNIVILKLLPASHGWEETRAILYEAPLLFRAVVTILLTPAAEELIFRGLMRTTLRQCMEPVLAMLFGAAIFGLYHGNISQGIYAFLLGIGLELVCTWSKSLLPAFFLHAGANAAALCFTQLQTVTQNRFSVSYVYAFAAAGLCLAALAFYKTKEVFLKS